MVLACASIFSRTSLDAIPQNLHTFSKLNSKYTQHTCPVGQARYSFHLPYSYNLQILLARGNGASTNVEPWSVYVYMYVCMNVCINAFMNVCIKYVCMYACIYIFMYVIVYASINMYIHVDVSHEIET